MEIEDDLPFQFFMARLAGKPMTTSNKHGTVNGYLWKGVLYVVKVVDPEPPHAPGNPFRPSNLPKTS